MAEPIKMQDVVWNVESGGSRVYVLRRDVDDATGTGTFGHLKSTGLWGLSKRVSCAKKTAGPILT